MRACHLPSVILGPFTVLLTYTYQIDKGTEMPRYGNLLQATQARKRDELVPKHILTVHKVKQITCH